MGIPKFYRWTSERYPCLSERIKEYQIPEFDNLYLDMNGIIHNCSHPNDEDIHLRIPEQQIFKDIFHYIDFLFKMIKPCKVFFMAVDGVAPRAKMNQQRGRRFRSARLAEDQEAEAIRQGETLPSQERFDSNCITPGTEFMARLHEQLKYFVQVKVSTDPLWQRSGLVIYLSGHDVPGEGEHKIMDFIRHERSRADYEPVRHCLYGLDADLVMLGLSTHELQFSLLREEVKFSRPRKPKKGGKQAIPPKPNNDTANYDLTNVSIFKYDQNGVPGGLPATSESTEIVESALLKEGQSFADAIDKPLEQLSLRPPEAPSTHASNTEENDSVPPPPPEESGAKGFFKAPLPEKTTFLLLHLSLMRDYIDFEFQDLKKNLANHPNIQYDLESVIDDWILMNILVGNDFVPHLPHVHIVKGALPMLYQLYSQVLPTLDGYINENGLLNLRRFEIFINKLSQFDIETFRETYDDMKYMESKTGKNIVLGEKMFEGFDFDGDNFSEEPLEPTMSPELKALAQRTEEEVFGETKDGPGKLCTDVFGIDDKYFNSGDSPELRLEFLQHKRNYYISKLHFDEITPEFLQIFCKEYIRAIQWVLLYYYKGVSSWGWFYPYHYAPFCSDLKNFANFSIEFDIGNPFRPFEQLLAVLPAQSKKLLPNCYQWLMTDTKSPIVDFYPEKFEQDLNGKKQDWEAVVLIPFIDEQKLLDVMKIEEINLNREELHRNSKGTMMLCSYTPEETGPIKSASNLFPVLESSHVKIETMNDVTYDPQTLPKGIHPKTKKDTIYQGFPTLKSKPINAIIDKADIKVFDFVTREESMILSLEDVKDNPADIAALARKLIGRTVWVNWPHLTFAYVTGILTYKGKYFQDYAGKIMLDNELIGSRVEKEFSAIAKGLSQRHLKCKGIKLGEINVIVYAKMMEGRKVRCNNSGDVEFETLWSKLQQPFALKTCMYEENITEIFYLDSQLAKSYTELFKTGDDVFYLGDKLFGALGTVVGYDTQKKSVIVDFKVAPGSNNSEVNLRSSVGHNTLKSHDYFSSYAAAGKCQISSYVLSRITGTVFVSVEKETKANNKMLAKKAAALAKRGSGTQVSPTDASNSSSDDDFPALEMRKINVGLDLKFNKKNLEVRGYTSKRDGAWFYSGKAVQLVNEFVMEFSDFISFLSRVEKGRDVFDAGELFPDKPLERINEMVEWLEEKGVRDLPRIPTNTKLLDDEDIDSVWKYILKHKSPSKRTTIKKWTVQPNLLLKPGLDRGCVPPIPHCSYNILDRVICVDRGAPIPVGRRGTIVGIQTPQSSEPEQIEESFKSTGAATLMTLIILCDPAADVFDNPENVELSNSERKELSGTLASLLRITDPGQQTVGLDMPSASKRGVSADLKPRLIKLYPYQLLNVTEGPVTLRQSHKDSKQLQTISGLHMNGHVKQPQKLQDLTQNRIVPLMSQSVGTIQSRSFAPGQASSTNNYKDFVPFESKRVLASKQKQQLAPVHQDYKQYKTEQPSKPPTQMMTRVNNNPSNNGTLDRTVKVLPWPPQPLVKVEVPINESFSVAAFLQQQFNAAPINKQKEVHNKQQPPPSLPPVETAIKEPPPPEYMHTVPQPLMPAINVRPKEINQFNLPKGCSEIFSAATAYRPLPVPTESVVPVVHPTAAHGIEEPNKIWEMLNKATTRHYNAKKPRSQQQQQNRKVKEPPTCPPAPPVNLSFSTCRPPVPSPPVNWTQHSSAQAVPENSTNHPQREQRHQNFHSRQFVSQRFGFVPLQVSRNASSKRQPNPRIPQTSSNNRAEQLPQPEKQLGDSLSQFGSSSKTSTVTVSKKEPVLKLAPVTPQESSTAPTASSADISKPQGRKSRLAANFGNNY